MWPRQKNGMLTEKQKMKSRAWIKHERIEIAHKVKELKQR